MIRLNKNTRAYFPNEYVSRETHRCKKKKTTIKRDNRETMVNNRKY